MGAVADSKDLSAIEQYKAGGIPCTTADEKGLTKNFATIKRVQCLQNCFKLQEENKLPKIRVHASCQGLLTELQECKWPDSVAEEKERSEPEVPLTKNFQAPLSLSYVVSFLEASRGVDVYGLQRSREQKKVFVESNNC